MGPQPAVTATVESLRAAGPDCSGGLRVGMEPMRGAMAGMLRKSGRSAERGLSVVAVLALVHVESRDLVGEQPVRGAGGAMRGCRRARRHTRGMPRRRVIAPARDRAANRMPAGHHDRTSVARAGRSGCCCQAADSGHGVRWAASSGWSVLNEAGGAGLTCG